MHNQYSASVGILMLDTKFPRILGDIGNDQTWDFPVTFHRVKGALLEKAVFDHPNKMLDLFVEEAKFLITQGVSGIATSCGFLSLLQKDLTEALSVPVATSSLMQAGMIQATLPQRQKVGIITISANSLSDAHLQAAGVPEGTPVVGTDEGTELSRVIFANEPELNVNLARQDMLDATQKLTENHPEVGAILLECTNMAPYASAVHKASGLPVYSIYSFINWFQAGLMPREFTS